MIGSVESGGGKKRGGAEGRGAEKGLHYIKPTPSFCIFWR
jgi:hypothetical protein